MADPRASRARELPALMALWQAEFQLVPRRALAAAPALDAQLLREQVWWRDAKLPADFRARLAAFLRPVALGDVAERWGDEDGDRVDVTMADGRATRVRVLVDVRRPDPKTAAGLLAFARVADAVLVRRDGLVVAPTVGAFAAALKSSAAWRFVHSAEATPGPDPMQE